MSDPEPQTGPAKKWIIFLVFAAAAAAALWLWMYRLGTYHFAEVEKGILYRDGNRGLREFKIALRKSNAKTVIMLNDDQEFQKEPFKTEFQYLNDHNIELLRIPVKLGGYPTTDQVRQFLSIANDGGKWPILVHCAQGVRRTGMMVAAYQESVLGYDDAKAKSCVLPFGRKPTSQTLADVKTFIDDYDGKKRELTTMPTTSGGE
jgi:protein tyrosine phosphatase (PTP) superfamily phosphohydrolase (DUF442 family)